MLNREEYKLHYSK